MSTTTKIMTSSYGKVTLYNESIKDISLIKPGDILLIHRQAPDADKPTEDNKYPGHCGLYLGNNKFIHATRYHHYDKVIISELKKENIWTKKLIGYKNIIDNIS